MGKASKAALRSENGKREEADALHIQLNRQLKCPSCGFTSTSSGAFNKDSGGVSDSAGRIYRRFKCRSRPKCGKTLGVTEVPFVCARNSGNQALIIFYQLPPPPASI